MAIKKSITIAFIILLAVSFMLLGIYSVRQYYSVKEREASRSLLQQELRTTDAIADDSAAAAAYKKLSPALPEIQLRILHRQWRIALELLQYMKRARHNTVLQNETGVYSTQLKSLLDEMLDRCGSMLADATPLRSDIAWQVYKLKSLLDEMLDRCGSMLADATPLRSDIAWQVYNVSGSAKLLSAFVMLENEQSMDKVQGVMRDALTDYKAAIEAVDKAGVPPFHKNIPRWNFELLNGEEYIKKVEVALTDMEKNQVLKDNLETLIPEMGGYAPGEPIETRIKK
jgi:hypothetical protein